MNTPTPTDKDLALEGIYTVRVPYTDDHGTQRTEKIAVVSSLDQLVTLSGRLGGTAMYSERDKLLAVDAETAEEAYAMFIPTDRGRVDESARDACHRLATALSLRTRADFYVSGKPTGILAWPYATIEDLYAAEPRVRELVTSDAEFAAFTEARTYAQETQAQWAIDKSGDPDNRPWGRLLGAFGDRETLGPAGGKTPMTLFLDEVGKEYRDKDLDQPLRMGLSSRHYRRALDAAGSDNPEQNLPPGPDTVQYIESEAGGGTSTAAMSGVREKLARGAHFVVDPQSGRQYRRPVLIFAESRGEQVVVTGGEGEYRVFTLAVGTATQEDVETKRYDHEILWFGDHGPQKRIDPVFGTMVHMGTGKVSDPTEINGRVLWTDPDGSGGLL